MSRINSQDWKPIDVEELEPNAWDALKASGNICVVAGPGAGKTEFLAQKASFLLNTGICRPPYRILAISFKKDAAKNLANRVRMRCPSDQANRFTSLTFDAFTKSLLDRFHPALPKQWQLKSQYELISLDRKVVEGFLERVRQDAPIELQAEIAALKVGTFEAEAVGSMKLPPNGLTAKNGRELAVSNWWNATLGNKRVPLLTFISINRLVELLVRSCPQIISAIRQTYPFVFVDEFQDTTFAQYDFLETAFRNSDTALTAVGDDKQRIMVWAGARTDAFRTFESAFNADEFDLSWNFRSSRKLVNIQHIVARALDGNVTQASSKVKLQIDGDVSQVWSFKSPKQEATEIGNWIHAEMRERGTTPRDYVIIVRQKPHEFEDTLIEPFKFFGLSVRNESRVIGKIPLQDLLSEELTQIFIALMRLATQERAPESWAYISDVYRNLTGVDYEDEIKNRQSEKRLEEFIRVIKIHLERDLPNSNQAMDIAKKIFEFLDINLIARTYPQYRIEEQLENIVDSISRHFSTSSDDAPNWAQCVDIFEGIDKVPIMTIHKSKGLEFDTVFFVGLDDNTWWSYLMNPEEGLATFFVALSRAKQRAIFTYCSSRGKRTNLESVYELLIEAGIPEIEFNSE